MGLGGCILLWQPAHFVAPFSLGKQLQCSGQVGGKNFSSRDTNCDHTRQTGQDANGKTQAGRCLMNGWQMHGRTYVLPSKHMRDRSRGQHTQEFPSIDQALHDLRCC